MLHSNPPAEGTVTASAFEQLRLRSIVGAVSLGLGIGIGLWIAWVLWPVEFINADPSDLRQQHKEDYVRMISMAYAADGDLDYAKDRLKQLGAASSPRIFGDLISHENNADSDSLTSEALVHLAQGLGFNSIPVITAPNTEAINRLARPRFRLIERTMLTCADEPNDSQLRLYVRDQRGRDMPNLPIGIHWTGGEDTVYTGLKPERGYGYADFEATSGIYSVTISSSSARSDVADNLTIGESPVNCKNDRGQTPRGWKLVFQQK